MAVTKTETGRVGEELAAAYLIREGFTILERNRHCGHKEIDLICRDGEYIVFVEVKARSTTQYGEPSEFITPLKQYRVRTAAQMYLQKRGLTDAFCRFDAVEVFLQDGSIRHIRDAF